jgi:GMP synthase-like glutamine amidotransferase
MKPETSILVLQHAECESPGVFGDELDARGIWTVVVELDRGEQPPPIDDFDALIVMGGPMSVNDDASLPWLRREKRLIADFVERDRPYWGVCLGAQLLAASLGARVYEGPTPEVGVLPVDLEPAGRLDPVFSALPSRFLSLQWHGDTFDLPGGADLLASSPAYRHQAFRWGRAYGLQFHLEVSVDDVREWAQIPAYEQALAAALGAEALTSPTEDLEARHDVMSSTALAVFRRWLDLEVIAPRSAVSMGVNRT